MNTVWSIVKAFGAWLTAASTLVVAVATIYLAFSARSSSESAREAAEAARESVDLTKRLFELSQRPLVTLDGDWEVNQVGGRVVEIRGELHDQVGVPTTVERICAWAGTQQSVDSMKRYLSMNTNEGALVFRNLHHWFIYPRVQLSMPDNGRLGYLSTVYTISREGTDVSETWRVESEIVVEEESNIRVRTINKRRVAQAPC